jgi:hypothetical protein
VSRCCDQGQADRQGGFALPDALVGLMLLTLGLTLSIQAVGIALRASRQAVELRATVAELRLRDGGEWAQSLQDGAPRLDPSGRWRVIAGRVDNPERPTGWSMCRVETWVKPRPDAQPMRLIRRRFCPPPQ